MAFSAKISHTSRIGTMQRRGGCEFGEKYLREKFLRNPREGEGLILVIGTLFQVKTIVIRRNPGQRVFPASLHFSSGHSIFSSSISFDSCDGWNENRAFLADVVTRCEPGVSW